MARTIWQKSEGEGEAVIIITTDRVRDDEPTWKIDIERMPTTGDPIPALDDFDYLDGQRAIASG